MDNKHNIYRSKSVILLATGMVLTASWAVSATGWVIDGLEIVVYVGLGAVIIGLMLARSMLPGAIAHLFSIIIGIAWSFWMTSRLLLTDFTWLQRWQELVFRLTRWYNQAMAGGVSHDNLMFIFQMGIIVWAMGYLTMWFLFRSGKVWQAIVPGGLVLVINLYYAPKDITFWFLIYILLSLLLVIRFNLFRQQTKWRSEGVFFQPDISFDFLRDGFIVSALVIGVAWLAPPAISDTPGFLDEFQGTWQDFQKNWNRLYADLNYRDPGRMGVFGSSLTLGGPRHLTDVPVMDVKVKGEGRYWRATVYNEYTGLGWRNTDQDSAAFGPRSDLPLPVFAAREPVTQTYVFYHDGSTALYAMSNPVNVNRNAKVTFNAIPAKYSVPSEWPNWSGSDGPWVEEITYIRSNAAVDQGESYQAVSAASQATVEQLKAAGADYPAWIERYLQLPDTITERTRDLARKLTEPFDDPFSKTQAVEHYLRTEIKYDEQIAAPPPGVDKIDYILFDLKQAYCDYYASSMIVMLRSQGIPARLAVGFAQGDYDSERGVYHVLNADAHSWVEVYFPKYGWVEFEPTAAQPTIVRLIAPKENDFSDSNPGPNPDEYLEDDMISGRLDNVPIDEEIGGGQLPAIFFRLPWFDAQISISRSAVRRGTTFLGMALVVGLGVAVYWWRQQQLEASRNIFKLYQNMVRLAGWMGAVIRPWQTPYEQSKVLKYHLPDYQPEVDTITNEYVKQTFGKQTGKKKVTVETVLAYETGLAWRRLRPEMIKTAIKRLCLSIDLPPRGVTKIRTQQINRLFDCLLIL
ncbi:transglutaminaseTgpA domain-containing protein [Chloroflexota bacterium]